MLISGTSGRALTTLPARMSQLRINQATPSADEFPTRQPAMVAAAITGTATLPAAPAFRPPVATIAAPPNRIPATVTDAPPTMHPRLCNSASETESLVCVGTPSIEPSHELLGGLSAARAKKAGTEHSRPSSAIIRKAALIIPCQSARCRNEPGHINYHEPRRGQTVSPSHPRRGSHVPQDHHCHRRHALHKLPGQRRRARP